MNDQSDTPIGVKMLADHLVKVKLQYEERINDMIVHMRAVEKEKESVKKQYKELEDELESRRREIYQMKRENTSHYVIEERENWKALVNQQKQENQKLEKDLAISKEHIKELESQIKEDLEKENIKEEEIATTAESATEETISNTKPQDTPNEETEIVEETLDNPLGPPQPLSPLQQDTDEDEDKKHEFCLVNEEMTQLQEKIDELQQELKGEKQMNQELTDRFIKKVDELEREHRERENALVAANEALKLKLDLELEKKWELMQEMKEEEEEANEKGGLISFLWG